MVKTAELSINGYEQVVEVVNEEAGLHAIIAIHNTDLGPALGGTRMFPYKDREAALTDVLRLAKGMSYKSALAEIGLGGGKSVIIGDPKKDKTEALLFAFADAVDTLKGKYICAEDVGTNIDDMAVIRQRTPYVTGRPCSTSSGDPSPFTAWGVVRGMQALATVLYSDPSLRNRVIAIQGLGKVGSKLASFLFWLGASLVVSDLDEDKARELGRRYGAQVMSPDEILSAKCDILSPCAMGAILNDATIAHLNCRGIAGSANNQLLELRHGTEIANKGILYAPDYVINSGGVINVAMELEPGGYNARTARDRVDHVYQITAEILAEAKKSGRATSLVADEIAEKHLREGIGRRKAPIKW